MKQGGHHVNHTIKTGHHVNYMNQINHYSKFLCKENNWYPVCTICGFFNYNEKLKRGTRFVVVSTGKRCHRNAVCTYDPDGVRSCVCKTGHVGDGYKVCKRMLYFSIYMNI
jgi:hypothetical protein